MNSEYFLEYCRRIGDFGVFCEVGTILKHLLRAIRD
jgi:hypothetical protein